VAGGNEMITRMSSVEIMGPLPLFDRTLQTVQDAGALHVEEIPLAADTTETPLRRIHLSDAELAEQEACQALSRVLQESLSRIPPEVLGRIQSSRALAQEYRRWDGQPVQSLGATARSLHAKVRSFARRESNMLEDIQLLSAYEEVVRALSPMVREAEMLPDQEHVGVIFEDRNKLARTLLTKELASLTGGKYLYHAAGISRGRTAAVIGIPKSAGPTVRSFLSRAGIAEMLLPGASRDRPFAEVFAGVAHELARLRERLRDLRAHAETFYRQNGPCLLGMQYVCQDLLSRYESVPKFARTAYTFVIRGWVASEALARLRSALLSALGPAVVARPVKAPEMDQPPVLLDNPQPSRSFEPLLAFLSLPRYGTIDPTIGLSIFFPLMFGLMLGDVGYGAIILAGAAAMFFRGRKTGILRTIAVVLGFCAVSAIAFGFVFGEMFGPLGRQLGLRPLWQERLALGEGDMAGQILSYLAVALGLGIFQITLGLILGALSAGRRGKPADALGSVARILGIFLLLFIVGRMTGVLPPVFTWAAATTAVLFAAVLGWEIVRKPSHGLLLPLEVLSAMGNILSYARIMAIGLASVVLGMLAGMFSGMIANIVFALVVVVLIHALNLVLGIVDPTIQGLRLQYVEFFSKFFQSGGRRFSPLRKIGGALA
jgi:V/A-type H+-transporting ATPase subunit I